LSFTKYSANKGKNFTYVRIRTANLIKNDKVIGSNTVWSKNLIHAKSSAKKRFGNVDEESFKRLTKDEYNTMMEEQKTKKLEKKRKW
jgi:hypothetical protein